MSSDPTPPSPTNRWLLRRIDQAAIAGCCLFFLIALGLYWTAHGGLHGRLIEIEHADKTAVDFKVDINTAEINAPITIPEVGQTLAQRIVQYRQQHGPYRTIDDLRHVRGIGPKTLERLRAYVLPPSPPKVTAEAVSSQEPPTAKENPAVAEPAKSP
jgi:competence protein ComEA